MEPIILGTLSGIPETDSSPTVGFNDPRSEALAIPHGEPGSVPREAKTLTQHDDGTGNTIGEYDEEDIKSNFPDHKSRTKNSHKDPNTDKYTEKDTNRMARGERFYTLASAKIEPSRPDFRLH